MLHPQRNRPTILRAMALTAVVGVILGVFAANRHDQDIVACLLIASLVIVVPLHLAIEGNRRDGWDTALNTLAHCDQEGPRIGRIRRSGGLGRSDAL